MTDDTKELSEIEGLNDELRERMAPHLRALADRYDRPIPRTGYAPPVLTADRAVMREAAQSVECLRAEVLRLQSALAADPLRAMLPDVVAGLDAIVNSHEFNIVEYAQAIERGRDILTRLRTLTPTEGGTDDGE